MHWVEKELLGGVWEAGTSVLVVASHLGLEEGHNKIKKVYNQIKLHGNY